MTWSPLHAVADVVITVVLVETGLLEDGDEVSHKRHALSLAVIIGHSASLIMN